MFWFLYTEPKKELSMYLFKCRYTQKRKPGLSILYFLTEYLIATLFKRNVDEDLAKSSEMVLKMLKGSLIEIPN